MRAGRKSILLAVSLAFSVIVSSPVEAKPSGYCLECHSKAFLERFDLSSFVSGRSIYHAKLDPCPGLRGLSEETFFTESRIIKLDQMMEILDRQGWPTDHLRKKIDEASESFSESKKNGKASLGHFAKEASLVRTSLQKVYERALRNRDETGRRWLIGLGSLFFLGLLVLFVVGYQKLTRLLKTLLIFCLFGGNFFLTSCSSSKVEEAKKSPGQERLEQSLSVATQSTAKMEEAYVQAFLLAGLSRKWSGIEPKAAEKGFQLAWQIALAAREEASQTKTLREVASRWPNPEKAKKENVNFDSVLDLQDELRQTGGRNWALRAVAEEWIQVNRKKGRTALEAVSNEALLIEDREMRDRELKSIAEAWAPVNSSRSMEISQAIGDPFLKATAIIHVALSNDKDTGRALLEEAWKTAETTSVAPYLQFTAFVRVARAAVEMDPSQKQEWAERVLGKIRDLKDPLLRTLVFQELIFQWASLDEEQARAWVNDIPQSYPEARAYSLIRISTANGLSRKKAASLLKIVFAETFRITDPFEARKVRFLATSHLAHFEPKEARRVLPQLEDPFLRSEMAAQLAMELSKTNKGEALKAAEKIPLETFRTKTTVAILSQWVKSDRDRIISLFQEAQQAASLISDPYEKAFILIELAGNWKRFDRDKEASLLDLALASARKIVSPGTKAEALEALAESWKTPDRAGDRAILDEVDPSVLRLRKDVEEIRLWAQAAPEKAYEEAERLPSVFPFEKASAFREIALSLKKTTPPTAFAIYTKAIEQALLVPQRERALKLLSQLITEAGPLEKEKTFRILLRLPDREMRDQLFKDVGMVWANEDSLWALRAGLEIQESSLRLAFYQRIADREAKKVSRREGNKKDQPRLMALYQWGLGRDKAKKEETEAVPYYQRAYEEVVKIADPRERSYLLSGVSTDWSLVDEEKALKLAETISPDFPEPLSYALLQIGDQLRKWNRKGAEAVFEKALSSALQIHDPGLRARRLLQVARQWYFFDREKGQELLKRVEKEIRISMPKGSSEDRVLTEILLTQCLWEPETVQAIAQNGLSPSVKTRLLLESSKVLSKRAAEEDMKTLEKALQFAQKTKNTRLLADVAFAWYSLVPEKGLEILLQIDSREGRIRVLRQMARERSSGVEASKHFLRQAAEEAMAVDKLADKIKLLGDIAEDWMAFDKGEAKAVFRTAYQMAERAHWKNPKLY